MGFQQDGGSRARHESARPFNIRDNSDGWCLRCVEEEAGEEGNGGQG